MQITETPDVAVPTPRFVPVDFDPANLEALGERVQALLDRPLNSPSELEAWIHDWSEVAAKVWATWSRRMIAMNCDTTDDAVKQAHLSFQKETMPAWQNHEDRLNRKYLESPHREGLGDDFAVFDRFRAQDAEIFREENTRLNAEARAQSAKYQEIMGGVTIEFRGETYTPQMCATFLQQKDRTTREEAWRAMSDRMRQDRDAVDDVFDELVRLRHRMAQNAGFTSYVDFRFAEMHRHAYTPEDCIGYHAAVEKVVTPAILELKEERRRRLGLDALRPYDADVSILGTDPTPLFADQAGCVDLVSRIFDAVDPSFAADFDILTRNGLLDLMSRPGKSPGGYNCNVEDIRLPFIFFNAVGRGSDLRVMLHEGGHAFHSIAARDLPVLDYRVAPAEFCEVASMGMELFGVERLGGTVAPDRARDYTFGQFARAVEGLATVALVDAFQAWVYAHPGHNREERRAEWIRLSDRFVPGTDWSGLEDYRANTWQRVPHFFTHPLYYIEYGIAQLGALQLWRNALENQPAAVKSYRRALALGGSRPLPELFEAAGLRFAMDEAILAELIPTVMEKVRRVLSSES